MTKNKFAGLAEAKMKALEGEPEVESKQEKQGKKKTLKQANKVTGKLASKRTRKQVNKKASSEENLVGITILIPEEKRVWWNVQAKLQRTTLKSAIIEALDKRFGEPKF
jgi:hypothetical protein